MKSAWPQAGISRVLSAFTANRALQRLAILIYHRVLPEPDEMRSHEPTVRDFDWQMAAVAKYFNPISLREAMSLREMGKLPPRAVCITFDDGYADNAECALPVLQRYGIPATVFVASGFIDGGCMWNENLTETFRQHTDDALDLREFGFEIYPLGDMATRRNSLGMLLNSMKMLPPQKRDELVAKINKLCNHAPPSLMMTEEQLQHIAAAGVEIGGHTVDHTILATLDAETAQYQIVKDKQRLELVLGKEIDFFAYPNGRPGHDFYPCHAKMVKDAGYKAAVTTQWGVSSPACDRWHLPRFTPWDRSPARFSIRLAHNFSRAK